VLLFTTAYLIFSYFNSGKGNDSSLIGALVQNLSAEIHNLTMAP